MKKMFHLHLSKFRCFKKNRIVSLRVMFLVLLNLITIQVWSQSERIYVFSVSETRRVIFSPGNLQYDRSTKKWSFASKQYEIYGTNNVTGGEAKETDPNSGYENKTSTKLANKIDLFGWSAKDNNAPFGVSSSVTDSDYQGKTFVDWGTNKIGDYPAGTWRTLTYAEWRYLRRERPNAKDLLGVAHLEVAELHHVNGLILLPDNWTCPAGVTFRSGFNTSDSPYDYTRHQVINGAEWSKLEAAEAVFLLSACYRVDFTLYYVHRTGYWSATTDFENDLYAYQLDLDFKYLKGIHSLRVGMTYMDRNDGESVRLVKDL